MRLNTLTTLAAALAITAAPARALQPLEARDGVTIAATISSSEPTRIRVEHARIVDVIGNIYSSTCVKATDSSSVAGNAAPTNPHGEFVLGCDLAKGEIYVRPVAKHSKPISVFITTERATYTLRLSRADKPAETIVLRDRNARQSPAEIAAGKATPHVRALKAALRAMTLDAVPAEYSVEEVGQPTALWAEVRFDLLRVVSGRGLTGEHYRLTNVSAAPMVLAEQEFDREGVLAVAIESMNLLPGESTAVYVIRGEQP